MPSPRSSQYDLVQWLMTKTGLVIDHQPGRYALGIHSIETPWTDVAPYLRADAACPAVNRDRINPRFSNCVVGMAL